MGRSWGRVVLAAAAAYAAFNSVDCDPPDMSKFDNGFDISTTAFQVLLERIGNPSLPPREILLDAPLVVRSSTRKRGIRNGR